MQGLQRQTQGQVKPTHQLLKPILEFQRSIEALTEEEQDQFLPMIKQIVANMKSELDFDDDIDRPEFMRKMFQNTMEG